jgi:hypothetical protein
MYNGEVVAAKEMDIGSSAAVQEAFLNVSRGWERGLRQGWRGLGWKRGWGWG